MSLTWHIVRKDLRRMAWPVAAWVGFVGVGAVWISLTHFPEAAVRAHDLMGWGDRVGPISELIVALQIVTGVLLMGHLVLEDSLLGTTAFWQTRPIGRGRWLAAKLIAGALLLVVPPVVVLVPAWLAAGFNPSELALAAAEFAGWQAAMVVAATGFAAITRNLAQFSFATLGAAVAYGIALTPALREWLGARATGAVEDSRGMLTLLAPVPLIVVALVFQTATRRTRDTRWLIVVGIIAIHAVSLRWPYDVTAFLPRARMDMAPVRATVDESSGGVGIANILSPGDRNRPHTVSLALRNGPVSEGVFAPESGAVQLRLADGGRVALAFTRGDFWGEEAATRLAGLRRDDGAIGWAMAGRPSGGRDLGASDKARDVTGDVQLARMRGRVVAELPLQPGATAREGSSVLRIVGVGEGSNYDRPCIVVEERDPLLLRDTGLGGGRVVRRIDATRRDVYLLVNRALGVAQCLRITELGAINMASLLVSARQLEFSVPEKIVDGKRVELPGWRDGAVLIKVRFELLGRVVRGVRTENVPLVAEEETK